MVTTIIIRRRFLVVLVLLLLSSLLITSCNGFVVVLTNNDNNYAGAGVSGGGGCTILRMMKEEESSVSSISSGSTATTIIPTTTTDVSYTVPRYYDGELKGVVYPSPLHSIHVRSILSDEEASRCLQLATDYATTTNSWDQPDQDRHTTYPTCDFPIEDCQQLSTYLESNEIDFTSKIFNMLAEKFDIPIEGLSYIDFFCAHYQARGSNDEEEENNPNVMDRLEEHRDGSLLSFTVLLNPPEQFEGGGTFFCALKDTEPMQPCLFSEGVVRPPRAGDACLHSGKLLHGADTVTKGSRTVLVGFVNVDDWCIRPNILSEACKNWGRMDVATLRYKRQQAMTNNYGDDDSKRKSGWFSNNRRWVSSQSALCGYCPAFTSVSRRADKAYQRKKKLEAEDVLLRSILHQERHTRDGFFGDITVL